MTPLHTHLLTRLHATLEEVEQGLRFRSDQEAARHFRAFLLKAIADLEGRRADAAA